jgi:hypothetical protein
LLLVVAVGVLTWADRFGPEKPPVGNTPDAIFRFEKEDLVGIKIERPDGVALSLDKQESGDWKLEGSTWRPSRSMVRRVAHQLHDLTARARVVESPESPEIYGLGEKAIRVTLQLRDGTTLQFEAGDPNPTSVSYYMRPIPNGPVYVVKKSAIDYYRLSPEEFREDRFATLDADDADTIDATVDGRHLLLRRTADQRWEMVEPVAMAASRDEARSMLGRVAALRADHFVQDGHEDMGKYGLDPVKDTIRIGLSSEEPVTLEVGDPVLPVGDPPLVYVYRVEDDAVYAARSGFLDEYRKDIADYRDKVLVPRQADDLTAMTVDVDGKSIAITKSADDWRWPDGGPIPGATPKRVAERVAGLRANEFHAAAPPGDLGFDAPKAHILAKFSDGSTATVDLGATWDVQVEAPPPPPAMPGQPPRPTGPRTITHQWARVTGTPEIVDIDGGLWSVVQDLSREYDRKTEKDAERSFEGTPAPADAPPAPAGDQE